MRPSVSVVTPAYNAAHFLRKSLGMLRHSTLDPHELIVVDDGSTDHSVAVAREHGAIVIQTEGRRGPAKARNLGAAKATGDILYFIDADVVVKPDTIERIVAAFEADPELDALMGSYDDSPESGDFLSQYRNLMHHFVHQNSRREACTFWSGCGAIRRELFLAHGGFDESYDRPAIEDIELGYRLSQAGCKMVLDREVEVKHLKKWTFWGLVKCDILDRGIPWTELILRDRKMPNDLNLQLSQRVSVALAFMLCLMALAAALWWGGYFLTPLFALLFLVLGRFWGEMVSSRDSRKGLVWTAGAMGLIVAMAAAHDMYGLIPPLALGYGMLAVHHRYSYDRGRRRQYVRWMFGLLIASVAGLTLFYLPYHPLAYAILLVLIALVVLNTQFYLFLAAKKNRRFALAAIPFHLLYHFYSGVSFLAGATRFTLRSWFGSTAHGKAERTAGRP